MNESNVPAFWTWFLTLGSTLALPLARLGIFLLERYYDRKDEKEAEKRWRHRKRTVILGAAHRETKRRRNRSDDEGGS